MTGSELLDARRNIRKELVAFISIVMIGLLAALAYLGIAYSAAALKQDALIFFNDRELWDVEVTSTMLMTDEDLEEIRALPGVREAERVWQIDTRLHLGNRKTAVSVVSLPEKMSLPVLLEWRMPENTKECAVERNLAEDFGLSVGQQIRNITLRSQASSIPRTTSATWFRSRPIFLYRRTPSTATASAAPS